MDDVPLLQVEHDQNAAHRGEQRRGECSGDGQYKGENIRALVSGRHCFGPGFQMVLLTLLGAGTMVCHHFFCTYLNGKPVLSDIIFNWRVPVTRQVLISAAGNAIAAAGSITLSAAIGIAAVQVLWSNLGQRSHSIRQIRAIMECRTRPFAPIAWPAWSTSRRLTLLAVFTTLMTLITIFAPSSLRTAPSLSGPEPCTVKQVDLTGDGYDIVYSPNGVYGTLSDMTSQPLRKLVARNLIDGTYIIPENPCSQSCSYTAELNAPAMNCTDSTEDYHFEDMTHYNGPTDLVIWNSTHDINTNGSTINLATMSGPATSSGKAFICEVYNATYSLDVLHNGTAISINVSRIEFIQRLSESNVSSPEYKALQFTALTLGQMLYGYVMIDKGAMVQLIPLNDTWNVISNNFFILYSSLGKPNPTANSLPWLWHPDLPTVLSELATNISISLLSNPLGIPMKDVQTICRYPGFAYVYNPLHLFLTYGIGLVTAIFCLLLGFISIHTNKRQETLHFSRLLVAILNPKLSKEVLTDETTLITENYTSGDAITYSQFKRRTGE